MSTSLHICALSLVIGAGAAAVETGPAATAAVAGEHVQAAMTRAAELLRADPDATWAGVAADPAFRAAADAAGLRFIEGPLQGRQTPTSVHVWLRTARPAEVAIETIGPDGAVRRHGPVASTDASDLTAIVAVDGLPPASRTPYRVLIDNKPIPLPEAATLATTPTAEALAPVRIAFGACGGKGASAIYGNIAKRQPTAMLMLGDNVYHDRGEHRGIQRLAYAGLRQPESFRRLGASAGVYAIWDDHDYLANDTKALRPGGLHTEHDRQETWRVFRTTWPNPAYGFGEGRWGVHFQHGLGACDVILLDNRWWYSNEKKTRDAPASRYLGAEQEAWLHERLLASRAPFILIGQGTHWGGLWGKEAWSTHDPESLERLYALIERHRIPGVVLLSGDRHVNCGVRIRRPSGFVLYEFLSAKLHGSGSPPIPQPEDPARGGFNVRPENLDRIFCFSRQGAFGELTIDPTLPDPTLTFRLMRWDGETVIHESTYTRSQLTPPAR